MGGDFGPSVAVPAALSVVARQPCVDLLLVGDERQIKPHLQSAPADQLSRIEILHTPDSLSNLIKPESALRGHRTSSMYLAVDQLRQQQASACVSAGNTGALMAMAKLALRTMPGIDRPALAALMPTLGDDDMVMLDLGANTDCDARNLVQFAIMGAAYSRIVTGRDAPRVRLLNIGTEENKGTEQLQDAAAQLRAATGLHMSFDGFIEPNHMSTGEVDVVVTDGFSGNIALKAVEGTARFVADLLRRSFQSSLRSKFGFLISRPATELLRDHLDPNNHNGAVFLGLNGVVVKSHGSATAAGVANAVAVTARLLEENITDRINSDLAELGELRLRERHGGEPV